MLLLMVIYISQIFHPPQAQFALFQPTFSSATKLQSAVRDRHHVCLCAKHSSPHTEHSYTVALMGKNLTFNNNILCRRLVL